MGRFSKKFRRIRVHSAILFSTVEFEKTNLAFLKQNGCLRTWKPSASQAPHKKNETKNNNQGLPQAILFCLSQNLLQINILMCQAPAFWKRKAVAPSCRGLENGKKAKTKTCQAKKRGGGRTVPESNSAP